MTREPLAIVAGITSVAAALVTLFGIPLSDEQTAALMTIVGVFAPWVVALVVRPKVTPVKEPRGIFANGGVVRPGRHQGGYGTLELAIGAVVLVILVLVLVRVAT